MGMAGVVLAPRLETVVVQALVDTLVTGATAAIATLTAQPVLAVVVAAVELMVLSAGVLAGAAAVAAAWVFSGKALTVLRVLTREVLPQQVAVAALGAQVGLIHLPHQT
jgi:putative intracellular protease/amidase